MSDEFESQEASQDTPEVEDLSRAAEEAKQTEESSEKSEEQEQHLESPEDNAEKSRLGRKVAAMERLFEQQSAQLTQLTNFASTIAQAMQQQAQTETQRKNQSELPEYIPTETNEFVPFAEKMIESALAKKQTEAERESQEFAQGYIAYIDELSADEDDPALVAEIKKLTTGTGEPYNKRLSNNPVADAGKNYQRAKKHLLNAQLGTGKGKENPFRGGKPDTPLGSGSGNTVKRDDSTTQLSPFAKRAAAAWGHSGKELADMMKE
jgi:hypothetical protein